MPDILNATDADVFDFDKQGKEPRIKGFTMDPLGRKIKKYDGQRNEPYKTMSDRLREILRPEA